MEAKTLSYSAAFRSCERQKSGNSHLACSAPWQVPSRCLFFIWPCPFYNVTVAVAAVCGALDNQLQVMCSSAVIFMSISQLATEAMVVPGEGTSEELKVFEATLVGYVSVFIVVIVFGVILSTTLSDAIFAIKVRSMPLGMRRLPAATMRQQLLA